MPEDNNVNTSRLAKVRALMKPRHFAADNFRLPRQQAVFGHALMKLRHFAAENVTCPILQFTCPEKPLMKRITSRHAVVPVPFGPFNEAADNGPIGKPHATRTSGYPLKSSETAQCSEFSLLCCTSPPHVLTQTHR